MDVGKYISFAKVSFSSYIDGWPVSSKSGSSNDKFEDNGHPNKKCNILATYQFKRAQQSVSA